MRPLDADRLARPVGADPDDRVLAPPLYGVGEQVDRQHDAGDRHHFRPQRQRPEEGDAVQEAEKQRGVAERRQRAPDVGDQEDEEDHRVRPVTARRVGPQERTDHQHGRAGGADKRRQQRPDQQQGDVARRRPAQSTAHVDPAADREQGRDQDQERHVVDDRRVRDGLRARVRMGQQERHEQQQRPSRRHLREVMMPEGRRQQRQQGDRQPHAGERQRAPRRHQRPQLHPDTPSLSPSGARRPPGRRSGGTRGA